MVHGLKLMNMIHALGGAVLLLSLLKINDVKMEGSSSKPISKNNSRVQSPTNKSGTLKSTTFTIKRVLNMLSFGKFYKRLWETSELYYYDRCMIYRGGEKCTTMMCATCFQLHESVGGREIYECNKEGCPSVPVPRDCAASRNIAIRAYLDKTWPDDHS